MIAVPRSLDKDKCVYSYEVESHDELKHKYYFCIRIPKASNGNAYSSSNDDVETFILFELLYVRTGDAIIGTGAKIWKAWRTTDMRIPEKERPVRGFLLLTIPHFPNEPFSTDIHCKRLLHLGRGETRRGYSYRAWTHSRCCAPLCAWACEARGSSGHHCCLAGRSGTLDHPLPLGRI